MEEDQVVKDFVGNYEPKYPLLDTENPVGQGMFATLGNGYMKYKLTERHALDNAMEAFERHGKEWAEITGRPFELVDDGGTEDADYIIVVLGSCAGNARFRLVSCASRAKRSALFVLASSVRSLQSRLLKLAKTLRPWLFWIVPIPSVPRMLLWRSRSALPSMQMGLTLLSTITLWARRRRHHSRADEHCVLRSRGARCRRGRRFHWASRHRRVRHPMANIKQLSARPDDLAPGHRLCGGCGASMAVRQVLMGRNDYDVVCCSATGCLEVSTSIYPTTRGTFHSFTMHSQMRAQLFLVWRQPDKGLLQRAGKIPADKKISCCLRRRRWHLTTSVCSSVWRHGARSRYRVCLLRQRRIHEHGYPAFFLQLLRAHGQLRLKLVRNSRASPRSARILPPSWQLMVFPYVAQATVGNWRDLVSKAERQLPLTVLLS